MYYKLLCFLISLGFKYSESDHSLYTKSSNKTFTMPLVYVDDLFLAGNSIDDINFVKHSLDSKFKIKYFVSLRYFLGFEFDRNPLGIFFYQRQYTLELLQDTWNIASKPSAAPIDPSLKKLYMMELLLLIPQFIGDSLVD